MTSPLGPTCERPGLAAVAWPSVQSLVIGIGGGSGSGKSTLAAMVLERLPEARQLSFDAYYRDLGHLPLVERAGVNFDHPDSLDHQLFGEHLNQLVAGSPVDVPGYDFANYTRTGLSIQVPPAPVLVVDGILLFAFPEIVPRLDHRVFIDVPEAVRFERRRDRDVNERGRTPDNVARQFAETVAPMHDAFVQPSIVHAHRVVPVGEAYATVATELAAFARASLATI